MHIPRNDIGGWAAEQIKRCSVSRVERSQTGAMYRNLYLTGDEQGDTATYNKVRAFIDNLSSYLYSPVGLRFSIENYGPVDAVLRAKTRASEYELAKYVRRGGLDTALEDAVTWSLVKGKTFVKSLWTSRGIENTLIQPELMGVLREDLNDLSQQDAFCHSTWITIDRFVQLVRNHPDRAELLTKAKQYISTGTDSSEHPADGGQLKQIILGGLSPYQQQGSDRRVNKGVVNWLDGPRPNLAPEVMARLVRLDELWAWDDERDDYTVIQQLGPDCVIEGKDRHRNLIADPYDPANKEFAPVAVDQNPLARRHPFIEICPSRLDGYFWGDPEIRKVALLQKGINNRMDGIQRLLRRQEDPPIFFSGVQTPTQKMMSAMKKPGGMMSDSNPNAKATPLAPDLPQGLWESLSQMNEMFNDMSGFTPILTGRGEVGVRSQNQAEELVRNSTPQFKIKALRVERQVEAGGDLQFRMLQAHVAQKMTGWVDDDVDDPQANLPTNPIADTPPITGTKPVHFLLSQMPNTAKIVVDSHSSSPAFSAETRALVSELGTAGIMSPERIVEHLHPPGQDAILEDLRQAAADERAFAKEHPQEYAEAKYGKKRK